MGRGELQNCRGASEVYPYKEGGGTEQLLAMLKGGGGHKMLWASFYEVA